MLKNHSWISTPEAVKIGKCPVFFKKFETSDIAGAQLYITAKGVYYSELNGVRVGDFIMAPGYTFYKARHQYQTYDITKLLRNGENILEVTVSTGWYAGRIAHDAEEWAPGIIAEINILHTNGETEIIGTDCTWLVGEGKVQFADIYDGEIFDATKKINLLRPVTENKDDETTQLVPQDGENVVERERFCGNKIIKTPKGETVIDFGQNLTGYPMLNINAEAGERVSLSFAETLDKNGNFYNENYRGAKCLYEYTCAKGNQVYKPRCTFYGFRYIRVNEFPESATLDANTFTAIAVYSDIRKTGHLQCSEKKLNQLFSNIFWGQRSNFLDIPTDCPQRDERQGWTGDAQVFCTAASYNFDTRRFFRKWLRDMKAQSSEYGHIGFYVPGPKSPMAAGWSDAAVIVPWQIYLVYGDKTILEEMIDTMINHVEKIGQYSEEDYTWRVGKNLRQFGDWLALDSATEDSDTSFINNSYSGATNPDFLQAAFYAYDVAIVAEALEVLGRDGTKYRQLHKKIKEKFQKDFPVYNTQTECVIALRFGLTSNKDATAALLVEKIRECDNHLSTGFVGAPHILHALTECNKTEIAYTLLLNETFPSWLFSVKLGATTMWEHWDSVDENGDMWSADMNSFNHYAYGAVADWVYEVAAGIKREKGTAGFDKLVIEPHPDKRLGWLEASIDTEKGTIFSKWKYTEDGRIRYEITVPSTARIVINGESKVVTKGTYIIDK